MCVCVCVCACVRACMHVYVYVWIGDCSVAQVTAGFDTLSSFFWVKTAIEGRSCGPTVSGPPTAVGTASISRSSSRCETPVSRELRGSHARETLNVELNVARNVTTGLGLHR